MVEFTLSSGAILNYIVPRSGSNQSNGMAKQKSSSQSVKEKMQTVVRKEEDDIEVVNSVISCLDIISKRRIEKCVKSILCDHIGCFDFYSFCDINSIPESIFERQNMRFTSRYSAIPVVQSVTSKGRQTKRKRDTFVVSMNRTKDSGALLKVRANKTNLTVGARLLTKKITGFSRYLRCPLCDVKFNFSELIYDDFMSTIMKYIPKDVKSFEINEEWVVKIVKEESPFKDQEIVSIDDDDIDNEGTKHTHKRKKPKRVIIDEIEDEDYDDINALFESANEEDNSGFAGTMNDPVVID